MKKYYINLVLFASIIISFSCEKKTQVNNITSQNTNKEATSTTEILRSFTPEYGNVEEIYSNLSLDLKNQYPYTYIVNKYTDLMLEYLLGENNVPVYCATSNGELRRNFAEEDVVFNKNLLISLIDSINAFDNFDYLEDPNDWYADYLYHQMIREILDFQCVQDRISEAQEITNRTDVLFDSLFIFLGESSIPTMQILRAEEYALQLPFDEYSDGWYIGDESNNCDCGLSNNHDEPQTESQIQSSTPQRIVRDLWHALWVGATITYRVVSCPDVDALNAAMNSWSNACSRLNFKGIKDNGWNRFLWEIGLYYHVRISATGSPDAGGYSTVGCVPWANSNFNNSAAQRTYLHELGHVLGLDHEHSRPDRDCYVIVNYNVISEEDKYDYKKYANWQRQAYGDFDYESIMIYFSTPMGGYYNILKINGQTIDYNSTLSYKDQLYINYLY